MTQIILLLILMTGSVVGVAAGKKRFEELLPITCSAMVGLLFLMGILNALKTGIYLILIAAVILWLFSIYKVIKEKAWIIFIRNFITPGFCIFVILYFVLGILCRDMVATEWDEFSHWADVVKAMVLIDDLGTNSSAYTMFPSYPPGMALFQYFFQKIYLLLKPDQMFSEWRLFFAYQIFFICYLLPFLRGLSFKQPLKSVMMGIVVWLAPMIIFTNVYSCIYIDPILGFISGTGFAIIFIYRDKDWLYDLYIYASIAMLILMKDAGMLFAAGLLIVYLADIVCSCEKKTIKYLLKRKNIMRAAFATGSLIIPKLLWSLDIKLNQVEVAFSGKIKFMELFRILIGKEPDNYRSTVLELYSIAFLTHKITIGDTNIEIPYIALLAILLGFAYILYYLYKKSEPDGLKIRKVIVYVLAIISVVFIAGMCVSYMFKFAEWEALSLAAFSRYLKIIFHCLWIYVLAVAINFATDKQNKTFRFDIIVFCIIMISIPWTTVSNHVTRKTVDYAIASRASYQIVANQVEALPKDNEAPMIINVICSEEEWCERLIFGYSLRPHRIEWNYKEGITAEEWQAELLESTDYVALYKISETFAEEFADVFENPDEICEAGLYKVNKETGRLKIVNE